MKRIKAFWLRIPFWIQFMLVLLASPIIIVGFIPAAIILLIGSAIIDKVDDIDAWARKDADRLPSRKPYPGYYPRRDK